MPEQHTPSAHGGTGETTVIHVRDMRPGDVYIGRANPRHQLRASRWRNPYHITPSSPREETIGRYEILVRHQMRIDPNFVADLETLRGHRLACWCHPLPCHGDVLVKILAECDSDASHADRPMEVER